MRDCNNDGLINYLMDTSSSDAFREHLDFLKVNLEARIHQYGDHFKSSFDSTYHAEHSVNRFLIHQRARFSTLFQNHFDNELLNVLSLVYFRNFNEQLNIAGINALSPIWNPVGKKVIGSRKLIEFVEKINKWLNISTFGELLSEECQRIVGDFDRALQEYISESSLRALFLYTGEYFYSKVAIKSFKKISRPTFILSHGLPGTYSIDLNADYLLVWGNKIRDIYIGFGVSPDKVLVCGHPSYSSIKRPHYLRSSLADILVLAKPVSGYPHENTSYHYDRGGMIQYLLMVKKVLKDLNIKSVRLRTHPTMNNSWLARHFNDDFFRIDESPLEKALAESTMVIGGVSTVFLEAILNGVNYLIFEPSCQGMDILGFSIPPPFDGSDSNIPVAKSEDELRLLIKSKIVHSTQILDEYLAPFDPSFTKLLK